MISILMYTFTDPMAEKIFGSLRSAKNPPPQIFWLAALAMGAQITDLD